MPSKNIIKIYSENGYYHIYNRGVEKRDIFLDEQDYKVFLLSLKFYLSDHEKTSKRQFQSRLSKNYQNEVTLLCYCLMPNHFHLLIRQGQPKSISEFMQSLLVKYTRYFNKKYNRVGGLFQGKYKAVLVTSESQLVYLSHYIHRNPNKNLTSRSDLEVLAYKYSSMRNYLGKVVQEWVHPEAILGLFSLKNPKQSYVSFISDSRISSRSDLEY